jgi:hypothetical protein
MHFLNNFEGWASGNYYINKFIQNNQLSAHVNYVFSYDELKFVPFEKFYDFKYIYALEWIPYERFYDIKYIEKIGVY